MLPALKELVLLLRGNLSKLGNGPCHDPNPCILHTITLRILLVELSYPVSDSACQGIKSLAAHGSAELLIWDPVLGSHAASLQSLRYLPELLSSVAIAHSLNVALAKLQTIHGVVHPSDSY